MDYPQISDEININLSATVADVIVDGKWSIPSVIAQEHPIVFEQIVNKHCNSLLPG